MCAVSRGLLHTTYFSEAPLWEKQQHPDGRRDIMRTGFAAICGIGLLLLASSACADTVIAVSGAEHFGKVLADNDFVVAEFYAPWYKSAPVVYAPDLDL